jgi:hypothetical protein
MIYNLLIRFLLICPRIIVTYLFFSCLGYPSVPRYPDCWILPISLCNKPLSVGLLWTSDRPVADTSSWQHARHSQEADSHVRCGIRTSKSSNWAAVDPRLKILRRDALSLDSTIGFSSKVFCMAVHQMVCWCCISPKNWCLQCSKDIKHSTPVCHSLQWPSKRFYIVKH